MNRMSIYFNELPVKALFSYNGNTCKKQSTRTAFLDMAGRWFYFGQRDLCVIACDSYCRLDAGYFEVTQ